VAAGQLEADSFRIRRRRVETPRGISQSAAHCVYPQDDAAAV